MEHPSVRGLLESGAITPDLLRDIWNTPRKIKTFGKNQMVINSETEPLQLMVITRGWFISYSKLPDGQRQVHRIYRDGDIIGDDDFSRPRNSFNVESATESRVAIMNVKACRELLEKHNGLLNYVSKNLSHNLLLSMDHAKSITSLQTKARLAHFILSMLSRIRWTSGDPYLNEILIPLNQSIISDYLGITNVHVSRTLKTLKTDGLIERPGTNRYRILDEQTLVNMTGFVDRQEQFASDITHMSKTSKRRMFHA